jgi:hypothetical protein
MGKVVTDAVHSPNIFENMFWKMPIGEKHPSFHRERERSVVVQNGRRLCEAAADNLVENEFD